MPVEIRPLASSEREAIPAVRALGEAAAAHDGVMPLNEPSLLALDALARRSVGGADRGFVAVDAGTVVGAAVDAEADGSSVDLVVDPGHRRRGVGTALLQAVLARTSNPALWAHGSLESAAAFAAARDLRAVRSLWVMSRDLLPDETFDVTLPDGLVARPYDGSDEQARQWLVVNAAAFVNHPEQGRMTMSDFDQRRSEPWFDPDGLMLVWDESAETPTLAASHWTKREPGEATGEVYVVAIAPAYQGRGIARPLTALGLRHLAASGVNRVELYVEGDNEPAKAAYARAGFTRTNNDTMYAPNAESTNRSEGSTGA